MRNIDRYTRQLYFFNTLLMIGGFFFGFYYPIFLYKNLDSVSNMIIETILSGIFSTTAFLIGNFMMHKLGYKGLARLAFLGFGLTSILAFSFTDQIKTYYLLIGVFRGISGGILTAVTQNFILKELPQKDKEQYFYVSKMLNLSFSVFLPILVGLLITLTSSYKFTFIISAVVYFAGIALPMPKQVVKEDSLRITKIKEIISHKNFKEYIGGRYTANGANSLNGFLFTLIPFLLIQSEFGIGIVSSITSIAAAVTAFQLRKSKQQKKINMGYMGAIARLMINIVFVLSWTGPVLAVRSVLMGVIAIFTDPVAEKLEIDNQQKLLGKNISRSSKEMNIIDSVVALAGTLTALLVFYVFINTFSESQTAAIQMFLIGFSVWRIAYFYWIQQIGPKMESIGQPQRKLDFKYKFRIPIIS